MRKMKPLPTRLQSKRSTTRVTAVSEDNDSSPRQHETEKSGDGDLIVCNHKLTVGDVFEVAISDTAKTRLVYFGKKDGYLLFADPTGSKQYRCTEHDAHFMLSSRETCTFLRNVFVFDGEEASRNAADLIEQTNWHRLRSLVDRNRHDLCNISIMSAPASEIVHKQKGGTCYAHACATAIRAVEARIIGRKLEPFQELVSAIVDAFGDDGGQQVDVLKKWCKNKNLHCGAAHRDERGAVLHALQSGRVVVASFELREYQWQLLSLFFKHNPSGVLTRADFERDSKREKDFTPELRKVGVHVVVLTGFCEKEGKVIYKIKNSWGADFASNGYFYVEADAFPDGFDKLTDVWFYVSDLPQEDIRNYLEHILRTKQSISVEDRNLIKVRGCSSRLMFVRATTQSRTQQGAHTTTERRAVARIQKLLSNADNVEITKNGRIKVLGLEFNFRVVSTVQRKKGS